MSLTPLVNNETSSTFSNMGSNIFIFANSTIPNNLELNFTSKINLNLPEKNYKVYNGSNKFVSRDGYLQEMVMNNGSEEEFQHGAQTYIFHKPEVKIPLLAMYSIVFALAFFGNLLVMLVMILHRRMRSHTNFFLTNLAAADLGVAIFCIYQNFALYVIQDWYLGKFLCQMYHFVTSLSCTASVIILVVVSGERYLAIVEPLRAKSILTRKNMLITMASVWTFSALYSCPRLFYFEVAEYPVEGGIEAMCILRRDQFDTKTWDVISLVLLFLLPLLLLTVLYLKIARVLCASSKLLAQCKSDTGKYISTGPRSSYSVPGRSCTCTCRHEGITTVTVLPNAPHYSGRNAGANWGNGSVNQHGCHERLNMHPSTSSANVEESGECQRNVSLLNNQHQKYLMKKKSATKFNFSLSFTKRKGNKKTEKDHDHFGDELANLNDRNHRCTDNCFQKIMQENSSYTSYSENNESGRRYDDAVYRHPYDLTHNVETNFNTLDVPDVNKKGSSLSLQSARNYDSLADENVEATIFNSMVNLKNSSNQCIYARMSRHNNCQLFENKNCTANRFTNCCAGYGNVPNSIRNNTPCTSNKGSRPEILRRVVVMQPSPMVLKARRKVVHMLILVVVSFAVFSLPFHTRKMVQYYLPSYDHTSEFSIILTPITCLFMFAHSAVNPILYTCLSRKFRASLKDLFSCKITRGRCNNKSTAGSRSKPLLVRLKPDGGVSLHLR